MLKQSQKSNATIQMLTLYERKIDSHQRLLTGANRDVMQTMDALGSRLLVIHNDVIRPLPEMDSYLCSQRSIYIKIAESVFPKQEI